MTSPRITIVTPSFNQARFLERTIQSVLAQQYGDLEYVVMDGGSTDGSTEIIRRYADRLAHWESAPDRGQADAIYRGFERGTGQILGWVNSDDLLMPGCLDRVARWFQQHPHEEWLVGGSVLIGPDGALRRSRRGLPEADLGLSVTYERLLLHNCGGFRQPATFWRRSAFLGVGGFDRQLRFCFDYDLYLRLAQRRPSGWLPRFLAAFRSHPASKTSTLNSIFEQENELLWRRHGRYRVPPEKRERVAARQAWLDRLRYRLMKVGWLLQLLRAPSGEVS